MVTIGWREWVALPQLGIPALKAKVDTGARTSALHAFTLDTYTSHHRRKVRFGVHPLQKKTGLEIFCDADVADERFVSDSGGHREKRLVIVTPVRIGEIEWPVEITLTNRDSMLFRMLLGRTALQRQFCVDPARSYAFGRKLPRVYRKQGRKRP